MTKKTASEIKVGDTICERNSGFDFLVTHVAHLGGKTTLSVYSKFTTVHRSPFTVNSDAVIECDSPAPIAATWAAEPDEPTPAEHRQSVDAELADSESTIVGSVADLDQYYRRERMAAKYEAVVGLD